MAASKRVRLIAYVCVLLVLLQAARILLKRLLMLTGAEGAGETCVSMICLAALFVIVFIIAKKQNVSFSLLPSGAGRAAKAVYTALSAGLAAFMCFTAISLKYSQEDTVWLLYGAVLTPFVEELIFRGYIWNKLRGGFQKEWQLYLITTALFALWHLGYIDTVMARAAENSMANIMLWKVIIGGVYGLLCGLVRWKTKAAWGGLLLHALMNVFGR